MKLNQSNIKTILFFTFLNFSLIHSNISYYTEESLQNFTTSQLFQNYFIFDNINNTNILYTDYVFSYQQSNIDYYKLSMLWFTDVSEDEFTYGAFFVIGQTKLYDNFTFSYLIIFFPICLILTGVQISELWKKMKTKKKYKEKNILTEGLKKIRSYFRYPL